MPVTRRPLDPLRLRLAEQLVQARHQAVVLTAFDEADLGPLTALCDEVRAAFAAKYGLTLGFLPFFLKAAVAALRDVPAFMSRLDGTDVLEATEPDLAVTLDTPGGIVAPVLRGCDTKPIAALERELAELSARAREGALTVPELQGGVLTLADASGAGPLFATPAPNLPQSGVLGLHPVRRRPVACGDRTVLRPMMYLALSYDARWIEAAAAAAFLARFKAVLETPVALLLNA